MPERVCDACGKALPRDAPQGLCPECLLRRGLVSSVDELPTSTGRPGARLDPSEPLPSTLSPEVPGRYLVLEETGQGGMGKVYLVRDAQLGREVALKQLLPRSDAAAGDMDHSALARFTREARVTAQLQHPAVTPVYELGRRLDGSIYYTMKFVRGRTLASALKDAKSLEDRLRLLPSFVTLCHAVGFAHSRGVIHRDIKPSNVMLGDFGETVIVDWGLAKIGDAAEQTSPQAETRELDRDDALQTAHGTALGTPAYMPPEQAQGLIGALDARSDIYSLGAVLYEILSGRRPYAGTTAREVLTQVLNEPARPIRAFAPDVPPAYAAICERAMARNPADRPASALELAESVQNVRLSRPKGSLRRLLERAALAAVVLVPLAIWILNHTSDERVAAARERLSTKGVDLSTGLADFAAGVRGRPTRPGGPRNAAGALYALRWEFPELASEASDWWKRAKPLDVREKGFPWPAGSVEEDQARRLVIDSAAILASVKATAKLPRSPAGAVVEMAMNEAGNPFETEIPRSAPLRGAAIALALEAYLAQRDGSSDQGLASLTAGLGLARHLEDMPWLISFLQRAIVTEITLAPVGFAELASADDQTLASVGAALDEASLARSLPFAVEMEIRSSLYAFQLVRTHPVSEVASVLADSPFSLATLGWAAYGRGPLRFWTNWDEVAYLGFMTDALEAVRRPLHEALPDLRRIDRESEPYENWTYPMLSLLLVHVSGSAERAATVDTRIAETRIRIALERFKRQHRKYPESLQELAPAWLDGVPVHTISGRTFRYRSAETGYELTAP